MHARRGTIVEAGGQLPGLGSPLLLCVPRRELKVIRIHFVVNTFTQ